ncbi:hypothetical protein DXG01_014249 [Tephrocybe rancida]|nr:hypothetical protein DXG01_014249 [Tephrocybe rancida]
MRKKRRRVALDLVMCWALPMIYMALHYVVQGHRFDIIENLGCRPAIFNSIQSIMLVWVPPLLVTSLTFIYAALALRHFFLRRITFARHLQNSNSALTSSRYFRLICMAVVQMFWGLLVIILNVWLTCRNGLRPWTGWADVHSNFSRVAVFPMRLIPVEGVRWTFFAWWVIPVSSVLFFVFFSFGEDAMKEYRTCILWVARNIFRRKDASSDYKTKLSLPSFIRKSTPSPISKVDITITTDTETESTACGSPYSLHKPKGGYPSRSSYDMPTPTTVASFSTYDPSATYIVPFPSREAYPLPAYR